MARLVTLRGMNGGTNGATWTAENLLCIGRLEGLDVVLKDSSVSRRHAQLRATGRGWQVHDLGGTNGTRLNGVRLGKGAWPLRLGDRLQFGEAAFVVEALEDDESNAASAEPISRMLDKGRKTVCVGCSREILHDEAKGTASVGEVILPAERVASPGLYQHEFCPKCEKWVRDLRMGS